VEQAVGVRLLQVALDPLRAQHAAVEGELVPGLEADDLVVLDLELHAALLAAEAAVRLDQLVGLDAGVERGCVARVGACGPNSRIVDRAARSSRRGVGAVHGQGPSHRRSDGTFRVEVLGVLDAERALAEPGVGVHGIGSGPGRSSGSPPRRPRHSSPCAIASDARRQGGQIHW
jgi:hypothetical protein